MKRKQKAISLITTFLIAASLALTACGNTVPSNDTTSDTNSTGSAETPVTGTFSTEKKTLTFLGPVDVSTWDLREQQVTYQQYMKLFEEANLELVFEGVANEQYQQVLQTRTAAAMDLPDIINLRTMTDDVLLGLGQNGILQDVKAMTEQYPSENFKRVSEVDFPNFWGLTITEDGKSYCMPIWYRLTANNGADEFSSIFLPLLRADWMEALNIESPTTADEFIDVLVEMRERDANGDGKQNEVLLYPPSKTPAFYGFGPLFGIPGEHISIDVTDHTAKSPWLMKDQLVPYLEFLQELVNRNVLDVDSLDKPNEYITQKIQSNVVSAQVGYAITDFYNVPVDAYNGRYEGVFITGTDAPPEETYVHSELPSLLLDRIGVTREADVEAVMRYFDVFFSEEALTISKWGQKGIDYDETEDGMKYPLPPTTETSLEKAQKGNLMSIWGGMTGLPNRGAWDNMRLEYIIVNPNERLLKLGDDHGTGDHKYYYNSYQLAMLTSSEQEVVSRISTDLYTYMDETLMKLLLGQYKIEDLDTYVAKMQEMGLQDMIDIYQARHDRYIGK